MSNKDETWHTEEEARQGQQRGSNGEDAFGAFAPSLKPTPASGTTEPGLFADVIALVSLARHINECNVAHGFWDGEPSGVALMDAPNVVASRLALIHSEVSEQLEALRDGAFDVWFHDNGKPDGFVVEAADVIIRELDLLYRMGLADRLMPAIISKLAYNETRPHKHGRKAL